MKKLKKAQKHSKYKYVVIITCDLCKKKSPDMGWTEEGSCYEKETKVQMRTGRNLSQGSFGKLIEFDICPECFIDKLVPALKEMGAQPTEEQWEW